MVVFPASVTVTVTVIKLGLTGTIVMPPSSLSEVEVGEELELLLLLLVLSVGAEGSCVTIAGKDWVGGGVDCEEDDCSIGSAVAVAEVVGRG